MSWSDWCCWRRGWWWRCWWCRQGKWWLWDIVPKVTEYIKNNWPIHSNILINVDLVFYVSDLILNVFIGHTFECAVLTSWIKAESLSTIAADFSQKSQALEICVWIFGRSYLISEALSIACVQGDCLWNRQKTSPQENYCKKMVSYGLFSVSLTVLHSTYPITS